MDTATQTNRSKMIDNILANTSKIVKKAEQWPCNEIIEILKAIQLLTLKELAPDTPHFVTETLIELDRVTTKVAVEYAPEKV